MQVKKSWGLILIAMFAVAGCKGNGGPSESEIQTVMQPILYDTVEIISLTKHECHDNGQERYRCTFSMEAVLMMDPLLNDTIKLMDPENITDADVKADIAAIFEKFGDNWVAEIDGEARFYAANG